MTDDEPSLTSRWDLEDENEELRAEVNRLRIALRQIAEATDDVTGAPRLVALAKEAIT